ncbi:unnamed protein product [Diamesa serratosioi]
MEGFRRRCIVCKIKKHSNYVDAETIENKEIAKAIRATVRPQIPESSDTLYTCEPCMDQYIIKVNNEAADKIQQQVVDHPDKSLEELMRSDDNDSSSPDAVPNQPEGSHSELSISLEKNLRTPDELPENRRPSVVQLPLHLKPMPKSEKRKLIERSNLLQQEIQKKQKTSNSSAASLLANTIETSLPSSGSFYSEGFQIGQKATSSQKTRVSNSMPSSLESIVFGNSQSGQKTPSPQQNTSINPNISRTEIDLMLRDVRFLKPMPKSEQIKVYLKEVQELINDDSPTSNSRPSTGSFHSEGLPIGQKTTSSQKTRVSNSMPSSLESIRFGHSQSGQENNSLQKSIPDTNPISLESINPQYSEPVAVSISRGHLRVRRASSEITNSSSNSRVFIDDDIISGNTSSYAGRGHSNVAAPSRITNIRSNSKTLGG